MDVTGVGVPVNEVVDVINAEETIIGILGTVAMVLLDVDAVDADVLDVEIAAVKTVRKNAQLMHNVDSQRDVLFRLMEVLDSVQ